MIFCSVIIPSRDGGENLEITLRSLLSQTVPVSIVVCDDHSDWDSQRILAKYPQVYVVRNPVREDKDHQRIGGILNMGWKSMTPAKYYMISGDDTFFPRDYIERVTGYMNLEGVSIGSGHARKYLKTGAPDGSGRIFTAELWIQLMPFIESSAWESGMLLKARFDGHLIQKYPVKKSHLRPYSLRGQRNDGYGSYTLGNPLIWTVLRVIKVVLRKQRTPRGALALLAGHVEYMVKRKPRVEFWREVRADKLTNLSGKFRTRYERVRRVLGRLF